MAPLTSNVVTVTWVQPVVATDITLSANASQVTVGQSVMLTATVSWSGTPPASAQITIMDLTTGASVPVSGNAYQATATVTASTAGAQQFQASVSW